MTSKPSIPAAFRNEKSGRYDPALVPKEERCRIVACPLSCKNDPRCRYCTGPVQWLGHNGRMVGQRRSCSNCPMNGLNLDVCYAGCPGPNQEFSYDGQSMVTLGSFADPSGFIEENLPKNAEKRKPLPDLDPELDPDTEADAESPIHSRMETNVVEKLLKLSGRDFDNFKEVYRAGNPKVTARTLKTAESAFRGMESIGNRLMRVLSGITGSEWDVIREFVRGRTQTDVAGMTNVRKQAVNTRLKRLMRDNPWVGRIAR